MERQRRVRINKDSLARRITAWHIADEGRCWWVYQYLSAPPFKPVRPIEIGFAQKDLK